MKEGCKQLVSEDDTSGLKVKKIKVYVTQRDVEPGRRFPLGFLRELVRLSVVLGGGRGALEVSLRITGDDVIRSLNRVYRNLDEPTDVLSFPMEEPFTFMEKYESEVPRLLGDVVVSLDTAERNAQADGRELTKEVAWLLAHGVLHLLGYDHQTEGEAEYMQSLEREILAQASRQGLLVP